MVSHPRVMLFPVVFILVVMLFPVVFILVVMLFPVVFILVVMRIFMGIFRFFHLFGR